MEKTLNAFYVGERGVIVNVSGEGKVRRRLFDMGVTPGAEVMLKKKAPLGDPIEISIRGYVLTLRKSEASCVTMQVENGAFIHKRSERTANLRGRERIRDRFKRNSVNGNDFGSRADGVDAKNNEVADVDKELV